MEEVCCWSPYHHFVLYVCPFASDAFRDVTSRGDSVIETRPIYTEGNNGDRRARIPPRFVHRHATYADSAITSPLRYTTVLVTVPRPPTAQNAEPGISTGMPPHACATESMLTA